MPQPHTVQPDVIQCALIAAFADGAVVSGSDLAQRLGISRAAIWKRIVSLRELGLAISGSAGSGYQLPFPYERLDADVIASMLSALARESISEVEVAWQVDSTNSVLMQRAPNDHRLSSALLAEVQTSGRGRRGRAWHSVIGGSLVLSLRWNFDRGMSALAGLSLVAGLSTIAALHDIGIKGVGLKWPNDVVADGRKLAGILVEIGGESQGPCHAVIGIGINMHIGPSAAADIDQPWIDVHSLAKNGRGPHRNRLAAALLSRLAESLGQFNSEGFAAFVEEQARYDALLGKRVCVDSPAGDRSGIALGVDPRGALRIRAEDGEFLVETGEVSVRAA
ncbi:MAG: biotin--[acetyl-CoA-carboxylase] ligase [Dokdonella sp.]